MSPQPMTTRSAPKIGQALESVEAIRRIGKYEILTQLSKGGMADLFLAFASGPGGFRKFVAVKQIRARGPADDDFVRMFLDEARITAALWHSNIGQVFELGEEQGELYLAMEFIPGANLKEIVQTASDRLVTLSAGFACMVIRDTCLALHHAHHFADPTGRQIAVIHRDVSPKNVMVSYEGNVKVIDFGIAKAKGRLENTGVGRVKGTSGYMSPEQIRGEELDGRSDLFSAGVMLYELLSGQRLFKADSDSAMIEMILDREIPPLQLASPEIPKPLSEVVMRALARDRNERFRTGKEMARALDAIGIDCDEEQAGTIVRELFLERMEATRTLMASNLEAPSQLRETAVALRTQPRPNAGPETTAPTREFTDARRLAPPTPVPPPALVEPGAPARGGNETILAVDDSLTILKLVEICLSKLGCRVVTCESPTRALEMLDQVSPDLVILDLMMPEMNGFELCRRIRERHRYMPILFLSGACSLEERVQSLAVGGDDFIRKPFEAAELSARVRTHLQRSASLRAALATVAVPPASAAVLAPAQAAGTKRLLLVGAAAAAAALAYAARLLWM